MPQQEKPSLQTPSKGHCGQQRRTAAGLQKRLERTTASTAPISYTGRQAETQECQHGEAQQVLDVEGVVHEDEALDWNL